MSETVANRKGWTSYVPPALLWTLVGAVFLFVYSASLKRLSFFGAGDLQPFFFRTIMARAPIWRVLATVACFLALTALRGTLGLVHGRPTRSAWLATSPLLLAAVLFDSPVVFMVLLAVVAAAFCLREILEFFPLPETGDLPLAHRLPWIAAVALLMLAVPMIMPHEMGAVSIFPVIVLPTYLVGLLVLRWRVNAFVRYEGLILISVAAVAGVAAALRNRGVISPNAEAVLVVSVFLAQHMTLFRSQARRLRFANLSMLVMIVFALLELELLLAPLKLETRAIPGDRTDLAPNAPPAKALPQIGAYFLAMLKRGLYNDAPQGWYIEVGRIRGKRPPLQKAPGTYRIVVQGSSSTEGHGMRDSADVWPAVLERKLNALGLPYRVEVINAGIGGTTSFGMVMNYKYEMIKYSPDMVILYIANNDQVYTRGPLTERQMFEYAAHATSNDGFSAGAPTDQTTVGHRRRTWVWRVVVSVQEQLSRFTLYRLLRRSILDFRDGPAAVTTLSINRVPAVPPGDFVDNLMEFARVCKQHGTQLVLVGEAARLDLTAYKSMMAVLAANQHLPYLDSNTRLSRCTADMPSLFIDTVHLTKTGNDCIGQIVQDLLVERRTLPARLP